MEIQTKRIGIRRTLHSFCVAIALLFAAVFTACNNDETFPTLVKVSPDRISRIDLSPNSPVLNADGTSELGFKIRCYYMVDTLEVRLPEERVPYDSITVTDSNGNTFKLTDTYKSTASTDSVAFTARFRSIASPQVKVALRPAASLGLQTLRIPLVFTALYTDKDKERVENLTIDKLQAMVARVNKVFAGKIENAPNGCDAKMEFYVKAFYQVKITNEQDDDIDTYLKENQMNNVDQVVNVWIYNTVANSSISAANIHPYYTLGSADDIPGLDLEEITALSDISSLEPNAVGIGMSYNDVYQYADHQTDNAFEFLLGRYYGLLETGSRFSLPGNRTDIDYCDDTFTYQSSSGNIIKNSITLPNQPRGFIYESYNIMDAPSRSTSLSVDQVKRIRKVIADCPYRQQGETP